MNPNLQQFADQNYLNLETLRKNGQSMPTPVWFAQDGEILYVRTIADSGKVKRIRANASVRVMPCGQVGEPLGEWIPAQAQEMADPAIFDRVEQLLIAKYGEMVLTFKKQAQERGQSYTIVKITL